MFGILEEEEMATLDLVQSKMRTVAEEDYRTTTTTASCGGRCQNSCDDRCDGGCEGSCAHGCRDECYM